MLECKGIEKLGCLLPHHAAVPDVYLSLLCLALGRHPETLEKLPPPETALELAAAARAVMGATAEGPPRAAKAAAADGAATASAEWGASALGLIALLCREGLRTSRAPPAAAASVAASAPAAAVAGVGGVTAEVAVRAGEAAAEAEAPAAAAAGGEASTSGLPPEGSALWSSPLAERRVERRVERRDDDGGAAPFVLRCFVSLLPHLRRLLTGVPLLHGLP